MNKSIPMFSSFLWAGFECTYARDHKHRRLDLLKATKHEVYLGDDYRLIKEIGISTVREGLAWHEIDKRHGVYDFSRFEPMMKLASREHIQQIWDLNHFDYPDYLDPFSTDFVDAFSNYARNCIRLIRKYQHENIYIVPLNEISFFTWIAADRGEWAPYRKGRENGLIFKKQLVKACIAAMNAIWKEDADVRFIQVDPFMRREIKKTVSPSIKKSVDFFNEVVRFEAWDMLSGRTYTELGGQPKYLDIIGINYYYHNQEWVSSVNSKARYSAMPWNSSGRVSFAKMLNEIYQRYGRPMAITETGSFGDLRLRWWKRIIKEVNEAKSFDLPIYGLCAYPTLDRPESAGFLLPQSGLWDFLSDDVECRRIPQRHLLRILHEFAIKTASEK